jgi:hypothetical protein
MNKMLHLTGFEEIEVLYIQSCANKPINVDEPSSD